MIEQDTIKLLRECDAGIQMGINSINDVLPYVHAKEMKTCLNRCKAEHNKLELEIQGQLQRFHDNGKAPNPLLSGMSWMKTNVKLVLNESDSAIAELMTDGCHMGVKSLSRYLNQYKAADEVSKDITKRLIHQEEQLSKNMQSYL